MGAKLSAFGGLTKASVPLGLPVLPVPGTGGQGARQGEAWLGDRLRRASKQSGHPGQRTDQGDRLLSHRCSLVSSSSGKGEARYTLSDVRFLPLPSEVE